MFAVIVLDVGVLNLLGLLVPLAVGVLAKSAAPSSVKALLNLGLSAVAGALASVVHSKGGVDLGVLVQGVGLTWGISILSYYGLYKPTGVAPAEQGATESFGIGTTGPKSLPIAVPLTAQPTAASAAGWTDRSAPASVVVVDAAATAAGWNSERGAPPYTHALPPPDAMIPTEEAKANPLKAEPVVLSSYAQARKDVRSRSPKKRRPIKPKKKGAR